MITMADVTGMTHMYRSHTKSFQLSEPNIQAGCVSRMLRAVNEQLPSIILGLTQLI